MQHSSWQGPESDGSLDCEQQSSSPLASESWASVSDVAQRSSVAQLSASAVSAETGVSQQSRQPIPLSQIARAIVRNLVGQNLLWEFRLDISPE
ncbi:MAG: hypothetical protein ACREA2_07105 [Blastocatellia bacterium]